MSEGLMIRVVIAVIVCFGIGSCGSSSTCIDDTCAPTLCTNGVKDGDETDVDCGGGTCRKCAGARACASASDCFSGQCVMSVMGTNTCFSLATVTFADAVSYESGYKPYVMMSGDLDDDGDIDLAAANEQANTVAVFRNIGDSSGMFERLAAPAPTGFPTGDYPTGGAIADFNRDGVADVITADYHGNTVSILLGEGTGAGYTLKGHVSYPTVEGAETSNLAVGDLNGDEIVDVIAANPQKASVSVFLGRADGTLAAGVQLPVGMAGSEPYSVAIGDFDADGYNDAAIADNRSLRMYLALGNGDGTFELADMPPEIDGMASFNLITRDMDLDGHLDLVVANRSSDDVSVLLGRGDGTFHEAVVSTTGPETGPYSIAIADFNLDGVPDVVTANYKSGNGSVLLGNGNGSFAAPLDAGATGDSCYGIATGDFDGDGKPDFATANAGSDDMTVKMNTAR